MTKTYKAKARGVSYTMTVEDATAPNGQHGVRITCSCATHVSGNAAIVATPTAAADYPRNVIHGHVTMAHSPINKLAAARGRTKTWAV